MEWMSPEWFTALLSIIMIDLVLAGDNAVVIGLAARNVPKERQKATILWGTAGAIIIRAVATLIVVWLLEIPGLLAIGGAFLLWIAYKLMTDKKQHEIRAEHSFFAAIRTIIIADAVMGLDNVIAVGGAAQGDFILVLIGLLISIPIVIWGSTLILKWTEKYPVIVYIGAGILAFTAAKMITGEPLLQQWFAFAPMKWVVVTMTVLILLLLGKVKHLEDKLEDERQKLQSQPHMG